MEGKELNTDTQNLPCYGQDLIWNCLCAMTTH